MSEPAIGRIKEACINGRDQATPLCSSKLFGFGRGIVVEAIDCRCYASLFLLVVLYTCSAERAVLPNNYPTTVDLGAS
jgi:hypothetical protein